jgi:hypothetical protein
MKKHLPAFLILFLLATASLSAQPKQKIKLSEVEFCNLIDWRNRGYICVSFTANFKVPAPNSASDGEGYLFYAVVKNNDKAVINDPKQATTLFAVKPEAGRLQFRNSLRIYLEDMDPDLREKIRISISGKDLATGQIFENVYAKKVEVIPGDEWLKGDHPIRLSNPDICYDTIFRGIRGMMFSFDVARTAAGDTAIFKSKMALQVVLRDTTGRVVCDTRNLRMFKNDSAGMFFAGESTKRIHLMVPYADIEMNPGSHLLAAEIRFADENGFVHQKPLNDDITNLRVRYVQPLVMLMEFSFTDLQVNDTKWDVAVLGPGWPDPYWMLMINGNKVHEQKSKINVFTLDEGKATCTALAGDTLNLRVFDDDGDLKRAFKGGDDLIGGMDFLIEGDDLTKTLNGINFGQVKTINIALSRRRIIYDELRPICD